MYIYEDSFPVEPNVVNKLDISDPYLIISSDIGSIQLRNLDSLYQPDWKLYTRNPSLCCSTSFDSSLYIGKQDESIEVWDLKEKKLAYEFQTRIGIPKHLFISDSYFLIVGSNKIEILEQDTKQLLEIIEIQSNNFGQPFMNISVSGDKLAVQISTEKLEFWNLITFQQESVFQKEEWIGSFLIEDNLLLIGSNECMELDEECTLNVWNIGQIPQFNTVTQLGGWLKQDFYSELKIRNQFFSDKPLLVALAADTIDIWEWKTWKHVTQIPDLSWVQSCELIGNTLLISDINGNIQIWQRE